ncbi:hypothetical protein GALMADRAFT_76281 [Galerina marginata CBS 339.88]|uniref:Arrestin-like N-terminal domain-containing protein n=1 Tax=Galerina marginata (strain CBS 339.88) TaxID=685588 RepID=A0A067STV4_GALM3|nr:hypothetical protein GALMADRAFT_76281 [Galerina marginata CBS 339.88]
MASAASSGNLPPPSYTEKSDPRSELPAYGQIHHSDPALHKVAQNVTKEFDYTIAKGGHPFLVMTLITTGPHLQDTPIFVEGSPVKGKIQLHLKKPDSISSVALTAKMFTGGPYAGYTTNASKPSEFLNQTHTVWTQEEPHTALHGEYTWPFAIDLPKEVEIADKSHSQPKTFRLPQTFFERFIQATIRYEIIVTVARKGILHSNELSTPFAYIPVVQPPPLPPLRRLAYEEGTPILGPKVDPDGWYLPKPVQIEGSLFNDHSVRAECRDKSAINIIQQLSYTRGSVIPLVMTLESDDSQLLDLLSSPEAISVRTRRHISAHHGKPHGERPLHSVDHSQRAVWWRQTDDQTDRLRVLQGEIHLRPDIVPTSAMGDFSVNYNVVLFPFDVPSFKIKAEDLHDHSLLQQPINIVTAFASGPRPRMSTPADYTPNDKMDDADNLEKSDLLTATNDFYLSGGHD